MSHKYILSHFPDCTFVNQIFSVYFHQRRNMYLMYFEAESYLQISSQIPPKEVVLSFHTTRQPHLTPSPLLVSAPPYVVSLSVKDA